jgi:DNA-binding NtrC family response regulator
MSSRLPEFKPPPDDPVFTSTGVKPLDDIKDDYIAYTLKYFDNRKDLTANALKIHVRTLYNREKKKKVSNV